MIFLRTTFSGTLLAIISIPKPSSTTTPSTRRKRVNPSFSIFIIIRVAFLSHLSSFKAISRFLSFLFFFFSLFFFFPFSMILSLIRNFLFSILFFCFSSFLIRSQDLRPIFLEYTYMYSKW